MYIFFVLLVTAYAFYLRFYIPEGITRILDPILFVFLIYLLIKEFRYFKSKKDQKK